MSNNTSAGSSVNERGIIYEKFESDIKLLTGKILTIIDASITDEKQNKAVKDAIKTHIYHLVFTYQDYCYEGKMGHSVQLPN